MHSFLTKPCGLLQKPVFIGQLVDIQIQLDFQFIDPVKKYKFMESISPFFVTFLKREQSMKKRNCSVWEQNLLFKSKHPLLVSINILR